MKGFSYPGYRVFNKIDLSQYLSLSYHSLFVFNENEIQFAAKLSTIREEMLSYKMMH